MGREVPALDIEKIARACGVKHVYTSGPDDLDSTLKETFREALCQKELTLIIIQLEK
jgi:thiamine pyrophosphate-dependent acetolactate synthase large subunit-like protein